MSLNLMGGARLEPDGLHLGHYLGCLTPLDEFTRGERYFFVIRDRGAAQWSRQAPLAREDLRSMLLDLLSTPYSNRIWPILQSSLQPLYAPLQDVAANLVTLTQMENVHPKKREIKLQNSSIALSDFLFPLESACTYFSLDASYVLMNDDNKRFVAFAQRLAKKLNNWVGYSLMRIPELRHGSPPRLLGFNYRKMCKANGNCIMLSDADAVLDRKIDNLMSRRFLFKVYPEVAEDYAHLGRSWLFPGHFVPLVLLKAFAKDICSDEVEELRDPRRQKELRHTLSEVLHNLLMPIREMRGYYAAHEDEVWGQLEDGTAEGLAVASGLIEKVRSFISS
jgi:tryptophanyl-tRNA synthetase